ncbi:MAG: Rpn family recombination-promoting nuclease/putative transposase [Bacillota bacterium]|nr:Rpn family recombination-promoting nuclease/putative transposase [Bacillota bacterium]
MKKEKTVQFLMKPKVDFCFKELMENEEVRNAFLAAVLGIAVQDIAESKILPAHLRQKDKDDKLGILDVRVLLNNREQIDIEVQVTASEYWAERTLFYLGKMFVDQLKPGEDYQKLEKCIHIGILNFMMFEDEEYYSRFHFWSDQGRKMYSDKLEIHTLELPKLTKYDYPETELLNWLQFINAETKEELEMAAGKSEYIKKAYEDLSRISADEEKRLEYEERERAIRDHQYFSTVYKNTGLKEGRRQAAVELLQEMGMEKDDVCAKMQEKFQLSVKEAEREIEKYWK